MTINIDDRQVSEFATVAAQRVLDRLSEGLIDEPQDDLLSGIASEIAEAIQSKRFPSVEVWNHACDL